MWASMLMLSVCEDSNFGEILELFYTSLLIYSGFRRLITRIQMSYRAGMVADYFLGLSRRRRPYS